MNKRIFHILIAAGLLLASVLGYQNAQVTGFFEDLIQNPPEYEESVDPVITDSRAQHILYGDESGGGHKYGVGVPCKTEFPADWDDDDILSTLETIAANDNLTWREEPNGYHVAEDVRGTLKIRVVLGPEKQKIITGYPINLPRNPCPSRQTPANDN